MKPRWPAAMVLIAIALGSARLAHPQEAAEPAARPSPMRAGPRLPPTLRLTAVPSYGVAPMTVGFLAQANDPENIGFVSYRWTFGDGNVSTLPPPTLVFNTYKRAGTYLATLTAATADGRQTTGFAGVVVRASGLGD